MVPTLKNNLSPPVAYLLNIWKTQRNKRCHVMSLCKVEYQPLPTQRPVDNLVPFEVLEVKATLQWG